MTLAMARSPLVSALFVVCCIDASYGEVFLKTRKENTALHNRITSQNSRNSSRRHLLLDFRNPPQEATVSALAARGIHVTSYLPATGVIAVVQGNVDLQGLDLAGYDTLAASDKLSPELSRPSFDRTQSLVSTKEQKNYLLVEFHSDVPWEDRRLIVTEQSIEILTHPDLTRDQLLVRATSSQAERLAEWDEVYYIFPASRELVTGQPLIGCQGAVSPLGMIGQSVQRVGDGWDGAGLHSVDLTYSVQTLTTKVPHASTLLAIQTAMDAWSRSVQVRFTRILTSTAERNINILFGTADHGDPYPFDGAGRVLAHTFYPSPPNPEPIAGDLHFDEDERWSIGTDIDVFSVALHELGHALGLGHSDVPGAVMYPYYRMVSALTMEDVEAVRMLYSTGPENVDPPRGPLTLTVTEPTVNEITTTNHSIALSGSLSAAFGTPTLRWVLHTGVNGTIIAVPDGLGGHTWTVTIPIELGTTLVSLTASDQAHRSVSRIITANRTTPPPPASATPPPAAPANPLPNNPLTFDVTFPSDNQVVASAAIQSSGLISGGTPSLSVRWVTDRGLSGTVVFGVPVGDSIPWTVEALKLLAGVNHVTFTAVDGSGNTLSRTVKVIMAGPEGQPAPPGLPPRPKADTTPPEVKITNPHISPFPLLGTSLAISGTASDPSGIATVRWECTCGHGGLATGTAAWSTPALSFPPGPSYITIIAADSAGNERLVTVLVLRQSR